MFWKEDFGFGWVPSGEQDGVVLSVVSVVSAFSVLSMPPHHTHRKISTYSYPQITDVKIWQSS